MSKHITTFVWSSCLACLAMALAASGALAQEQQDQASQSEQQHEQSENEQDRDQHDDQNYQEHEAHRQQLDDDDDRDADRQRAQRPQQRAQQDQQRAQQDRQRSRQDSQRAQQDLQRSQRPYQDDRGARFPEPDRDSYGRQQSRWNDQRTSRTGQWSDEQQYGRDGQQTGRDSNEAGLGVSVAESREGVRVVQVHPGSPAEEMGIRRGDEITHVNGDEVESVQQFVSQIREMDPGDDVELDIIRNSEDKTIRGELRTRQQALVLRGGTMRGQQQWSGRDAWQTGYEDRGLSQQQTRAQGGNIESQLGQIERQVNRLSREIDDLRFALRDLRQQSGQFGRETTAGYNEYQTRGSERIGTRQQDRWHDQDRSRQIDGQRSPQSRQFDTQRDPQLRQDGYQSGQRQRSNQTGTSQRGQSDRSESIGGEVGEARQRPDRD